MQQSLSKCVLAAAMNMYLGTNQGVHKPELDRQRNVVETNCGQCARLTNWTAARWAPLTLPQTTYTRLLGSSRSLVAWWLGGLRHVLGGHNFHGIHEN